MAPEVTNRDISGTIGYDGFAADMWSLGVCLFAMHLAFFPFEQANPDVDWRARRVVQAQKEGRSTMATILSFYPAKAANGGLSDALLALLDRLLIFNPQKRATLGEVLCSEWLQPHVPALLSLSSISQHMRLATRTLTASTSSSEGPPTPRSADGDAALAVTSRDASTRHSASDLRSARLERHGSGDTTHTTSSNITSSSVASYNARMPLPFPPNVAAEAGWLPNVMAERAADVHVVVAGASGRSKAQPQSPTKHARAPSDKDATDAAQLASLLAKACKVSNSGSPRRPDRGLVS